MFEFVLYGEKNNKLKESNEVMSLLIIDMNEYINSNWNVL